MPIIALQRSSKLGEAAGVLYVNTDQIVTIEADEEGKATKLTLGSGVRWVLDKPEDIASKAK